MVFLEGAPRWATERPPSTVVPARLEREREVGRERGRWEPGRPAGQGQGFGGIPAPFYPHGETGRWGKASRSPSSCALVRGAAFREGRRLMGAFADFAFMIYLLFMHDNIDPPLGGLVNVGLLPKLQSRSITRE